MLKLAAEHAITTLSITDHDTVDGYMEALPLAAQYHVRLIPGIEFSTSLDGKKEIHILGYFFDPANPAMQEYITFFKTERISRAEQMIRNLIAAGYDITMEEVMQEAGVGAVGRPHIARALHKKGVVKKFQKAFETLIGHDSPFYVPKTFITPQMAIDIIHRAGGLAFIAHPGLMSENRLLPLMQMGFDGIEVVHHSHSEQQREYFNSLAAQQNLLASGGSDFHGGKSYDYKNFPTCTIPDVWVEIMRRRLKTNS